MMPDLEQSHKIQRPEDYSSCAMFKIGESRNCVFHSHLETAEKEEVIICNVPGNT